MTDIISFSGVTVKYGKKIALSNVSLSISEGEFVSIIGPNGSGKTTLLKAILGLIRQVSGEIKVFGQKITHGYKIHRKRIGYLPQMSQVDINFPIKVMDVVMLGRCSRIGFFRRPTKQDKEIVFNSLEKVGMEDSIKVPFGHLSAGQQQRVMIAKVLAQEPDILILDEPTAGIDLPTQYNIVELIDQLHNNGMTIIYVCHEINIFTRNLKKIICLKGYLYKMGSPEEVLNHEVLTGLYDTPVNVVSSKDYHLFTIGG
jgi:ABC-type Mn2+/Zn2+ transport system ATPase subunit